MGFASINGTVLPVEEARVSVLDNGFAFGDSVYEVLRTYGGRPFEPGRHFRRLRASAARLWARKTRPNRLPSWSSSSSVRKLTGTTARIAKPSSTFERPSM